jgi:hypothetical protein
MAQDIVNPLQSTSYTNKDFEDIYPELLDLVFSLTTKWDPSMSNESDPGVILLKLNALIADKCNYNTDKNILETFPLSVTQERNARQLFEQLGYYMKWYQAATTDINLNWIGTSENTSYTIPAFTMVTDYDSQIVYSLVGPTTGTTDDTFNVGSQELYTDGSTINFKAIQGIAIQYSINNETTIDVSNLDYQNRLYFSTTNIAENGIFITNVDKNNYSDWIRKDNLYVEELGNTFYRFGVSVDDGYCYLEFPDDAETIFGDGIQIVYIQTDGESGNVSAQQIEKFYTDLTPVEDSEVTLNSENVSIKNLSSTDNGYDPETIDEAYEGYKKTVGTFNTLLTLRDYTNAILNSKLVSNCMVTDRTNDVQESYKIMTSTNEVNKQVIEIEKDSDVDAFSLKLYLTQYVENPSNADLYNQTFNMLNPYQCQKVESYIEDIKCISHDYSSILDKTDTNSHFCFFKNKYPIVCRIVPQYVLDDSQKQAVKYNIITALYKALNAKELNFGDEIEYDLVKQTIYNSDSRIKDVNLNDLVYTTYAVYYEYGVNSNNGVDKEKGSFREVQINNLDREPEEGSIEKQFRDEIYAKSILAGTTQLLNKDETFDYKLNQQYNNIYENIDSLSTDVTVHLDKNNNEYQIRQNETIQFYAPNLIDSSSYSNYVLFDYYITSDISKSVNYKLKDNEYVIFYWKDSDSDEYYQFYVYGKGNVIYSTFDLTADSHTPVGASLADISQMRNIGTTTEPIYINVGDLSDEGNIESEVEQMSKKSTRVLTGSKKITTKTVNKVTITDTGFRAYWILSNSTEISSEDRRYVIFDSTPIYDNKHVYDKDDIVLYNNIGYRCLEDDVSGEWDDTKWSSSDVLEKKLLSSGEYFFYTDSYLSDLVILGSGTEIVRKPSSQSWSVPVLDSTTILTDGVSAFNDSDWFMLSANTLPLTITENQYLVLNEGCSIRLTNSSDWSVDLTRHSEELTNYTIEYKTADSDEYSKLEDIVIGEHSSWKGRALLNLSVSATSELNLLSNQKITIHQLDGTTQAIEGGDFITGGTATDESYWPVCLLSSLTVDIDGTQDVEIENEDLDGNRIYLGLYSFKHITSPVAYDEYGGADFTLTKDNPTATFNIALPVGTYILPITISVDNCPVEVKVAENKLPLIYDSTTAVQGIERKYLAMNIESTGKQAVTITGTNVLSKLVVSLDNCYKYNIDEDKEYLLNLISKLDYEHLYDYTYVVDESSLIKDPLDPMSFFEPEHIYNSNVICQMEAIPYGNITIKDK